MLETLAHLGTASEQGVLIFAIELRTIRAVTPLDVAREQCERAAHVLRGLVDR